MSQFGQQIGQRLQDIWYGDRSPGVLLRTLEQVYRAAAERRSHVQPDPELVGKPIIVVGNITAGGTGKTPLVMRLTQLLAEAGYTVAVISRGYGRQGDEPLRVNESTSARDGGDEPVLIARRCGVPVYVDADREAAAKRAFAGGAQVVLSDDGLQRASLPRLMELCVVDGARGFGNGRLMPAGPLREPVERLETVDAVVVNGRTDLQGLPDNTITMTLRPTVMERLDGSRQIEASKLPASPEFQSTTALAGTGNPSRFFDTLRTLGLDPDPCLAFADHHTFCEEDFDGIEGTLLMTEKDAVKCRGLAPSDAWFLAVEAELEASWEQAFIALSEAIIGQ